MVDKLVDGLDDLCQVCEKLTESAVRTHPRATVEVLAAILSQ